MLVPELFVYFRESHCRIAALDKRDVIAAASVSIAPVNHHHFALWHKRVADLFDKPCELSRRGVILATDTAPRRCLRRSFVRWHAFGEHTHVVAIAHAIAAERVADDVVGEHRIDIPVFLFCLFGIMSRPEQALLFTSDGHENDGRVKLVLRHHARHL